MAVEIDALANDQPIGWTGGEVLTRLAAGSVSLNASLTLTGGTRTTSVPLINGTQTWNDAAVTFTGVKYNITDTASAAASLLMDLQVGGVVKVSARKDGLILSASGKFMGGAASAGYTGLYNSSETVLFEAHATVGAIVKQTAMPLGWSDALFYRDTANTIAQRNAANAQTFNLYGTYTDASNYRRLAVSSTTSGVFSLSATGAGTGSAGNVLHISSLPTSNPGAGILWNNAGTPAIGT